MTNTGPGVYTEYTAAVNCANPINTPASAPVKTNVGIGTAYVWRVEIEIPAGHYGYTGIALVDSGAFIIPFANPGPAWLIGNDRLLEYPYDKQTGANLQFWSFNTSTDFPHTFYCRVIYTPITLMDESPGDISVPDLTAWLSEIGTTGE